MRLKFDCRHDSPGQGLVELLVVLGLAGILAGGAVPGIRRISREWELWGCAHMLENSLQWARMHAISANDSLALIIDEDGRRFYWTDPEGRRYENSVRTLPAGVRIASSPRRPLRFYQHGNAVPAGTFVVQGAAGSYRVIVNVAGRIRMQRD